MNKHLKVLVISSTYPPMTSGGADYAFRLCQKLVSRGAEVHVLTSKLESYPEYQGLTVYPWIKHWTWLSLPRVLKIILELRPDVINLHYAGNIYDDHPMICLLPSILSCLGQKYRLVTLIENALPARVYLCSLPVRSFHKLLSKIWGRDKFDYGFGTLINDSESIIALSEQDIETLELHCAGAAKKCHLIPPPPLMRIETNNREAKRQEVRREFNIPTEAILIAYSGYIYPGKGLETLLSAFALLRKSQEQPASAKQDIRLIIIGGIPEIMLEFYNRKNFLNELKSQAEQLGIAQFISWTGGYDVESPMPSLYLNAADIAILPFDGGVRLANSSFGSVASHGLPIITTQSAKLESAFRNEENVLLVKPGDHSALANATERLLNDQALRHKLSLGAQQLAKDWFNWDSAADKILSLLKA